MQERIKQVRKAAGLNQTDFGKQIGVTQSTVAGYENGSRTPIDAVVLSICKAFHVNQTWLLTGDGEMNAPVSEEQELAQISAALFREDDQRRINLFRFVASLDEDDMRALERIWSKAFDFFGNKEGE